MLVKWNVGRMKQKAFVAKPILMHRKKETNGFAISASPHFRILTSEEEVSPFGFAPLRLHLNGMKGSQTAPYT